MKELRGYRTLIAGLIGMLCMVVGLKLVAAEHRGAAYVFFATGISAIVAGLVTKSVGTSAVNGEGLKQGWKNLVGPSTPGEPKQ
jgi:vacuolar-type H+-ATPase subunit I/STV1